MRLTISKKLIIGFLSAAIFFGGTSGAFYYYINKVNSSYSELINLRVTILTNAKDMHTLALQQTNGLRGYLLTRGPEFLNELQTANTDLNELIEETKSLVTEKENKELVLQLDKLNKEFNKKYEELLIVFEANQDQEEALNHFKTKVLPTGTQLAPLTKILTENQQKLMDEASLENTKLVEHVNKMSLFLSITALIFTIIIGLFISRSMTRNLSKIMKVITGLTAGSSTASELTHIEVNSKDEFEDIAQAFNEMAASLQERSWLETNITEMATMSHGIHDLHTLAQQFITRITPIVEASYGVFYIKQGIEHERFFKGVAAYAYNNQELGLPSFRYGEGLVGQAALENKTILLTDIPENYVQISSGIGASSPSNLMIIPVEFDGDIIAAIELASFKEFKPIQKIFLNQVLSQVGITLDSVSSRMKTEHLLKDSKELTEELQVQSEELQQQQEELISINEKLEEQYRNSEQKTKELNQIKMELEEKAEELILTSNYKSEFLANMSHELRSPLNSLLILAKLLVENESGNLTKKQVEFADTIFKSGNDLLHLINEILDLSKIEAGKVDVIPDVVSLKDICLFAKRQFLPIANQKELTFKIEKEDTLPETLWTDQQRLQQILNNLLSNAFKFTDKGEILLHIYKADGANHPKLQNIDGSLAFSIKDTGIGISKEDQKRIFKSFQQGDGTTSRKYGGTGLGLSISQKIAHLLGGEIEVESTKGKGSTFTFYLPIQPSEDRAPDTITFQNEAAAALAVSDDCKQTLPDIQDAKPLLKGKKILIVDDDMRNIFAITTALENKHMKVVFADNGKQGINVLKDNPDIDLILMDIMLPEMDGYEAIRVIRQIPEYEMMPIIALTAKAMKHDREKCIEAGASDYISKPVDLDQLFSLIQVWLYR
ncbi:ATP-binding protein [Bacillus taeanensis]|uniref:ATP-binding protein n=1 Tax=Bacillus taeanensis TaxID=273032 RepID=UPI0015F00595|nr:ATP-binding protein [Bacillus taeanensis]